MIERKPGKDHTEAGRSRRGILAEASRGTTAERSRRYRDRRRAGKVVATVEVDDGILAMLAAGTATDMKVLRADRARINDAVRRALWHLTKCYFETGRLPTR